ncbi:TerB family tellurite resistance protein [Pedobacter rhodius]|uniref:TerB family tellurite resistance protein n=1 Tax=Pedobacter rhodius TaxID=3004098 RepID=A0ABT4KX63_9SPHI|nr:TerB family tellurite resistance protein [Pedobacter sp. SJ11]MCZ4223518.1 TerB family tellurite resistance protein [Pedobacter sp. SJ11]
MKPIIKQRIICFAFLLLFISKVQFVNAQSQETQQLLLNVEKLSQLKNILSDMKRGYSVISNGYNSVNNIAQGNFSLHEVFLDGLMLVNPEIKKYRRVADIISYQKKIITEYKTAYNRFKSSSNFSPQEIDYLGKVYRQLFDQSLDNIEELTTVITSSKLRMSDDERLQAIERIFADTEDKLVFLRNFNKEASILNLQRKRETIDLKTTQGYFGIN